MKKIVFASVMALASISLVAPMLHAQDQGGTIKINDPAEFNAYQMATTQSDPKAKAAALEQFLTQYPNSVVKSAVLDMLVDTYQQVQEPEKTLDAAHRLLQIDANNMKATLISVFVRKSQCAKSVSASGKSSDPQTCDDAATLAKTGLGLAKPAATSADDWAKQTAIAYPVFHSAIALDDTVVKKDYKSAEDEYTDELKLYSDEQSKTAGPARHAASSAGVQPAGTVAGFDQGDLALCARVGSGSGQLQGADCAEARVLLQEVSR